MSEDFSSPLKVGDRIEFKDPNGEGDRRKVGVIQELASGGQKTVVVKDDSRDAIHLIKLEEVMRKIEDLQKLDEITHSQTPLPI